MKKRHSLQKGVFTIFAASAMWAGANAQVTAPGTTQGHFHACPSSDLTRKYVFENGLEAAYGQALADRKNTSAELPAGRAVRTLPVVFHVIYGSPAENIPDQYIHNLMLRLNEDFRKNSAQVAGIRPAFANVAADAQIEFCLATKDPNGNPTTGITRTQTNLTYFKHDADDVNGNVGGQNSMKTAQYGKAPWNRSNYINVWICDLTNGASSGVAGYAYIPVASILPPAGIDGIVLDYNIGVEQGNSHSISHEMGHFLGLDHTFGLADGTCNPNNDDGFSDTPPVKNAFQNLYPNGCSSATTAQSCTNGLLWQYENMMDYSDCGSMFTTQQANYMNVVLSLGRSSLTTSAVTACSQAGVQAPVANFGGCGGNIYQNGVVTFTDGSVNAPTSWQWNITPATGWAFVEGTSAASQNPKVKFTAAGSYSVKLTVTNGSGNNSKTSDGCVVVKPGYAGVADNEAVAGVAIYPNPATDAVTVSIANASQYTNLRVTVYNAVGQTLYRISENIPSEIALDLSGYGQGVYFVEVRSGGGVTTKRLVIGR